METDTETDWELSGPLSSIESGLTGISSVSVTVINVFVYFTYAFWKG